MTGTRTDGYSALSIAVHWLAAIAVVVLFITGEGERGSSMRAFHIGGGAIIGLFLLWRVWRRLRLGPTDKPDQHALLNLASQIVIFGLLAAIVVTVLTGYMLPWTIARPIDIYGLISIPSPIGRNPALHELMEELHEVASHAFIPLLALHILGTAKHALIDRDGVAQRMVRAVVGGR